MRISASGWRNSGSPRRSNGPTRRLSRSCPPKRKAISYWRKSASGKTAGPRPSASGEQVARIRSLEPTGLLGLAEALIHEHRSAEASDVLARLKQKSWPARFENGPVNLREKIRSLEEKMEQDRK